MSAKQITDWDEYFERRKQVRFNWWRRSYDNRLLQAKDINYVRARCQQEFYSFINQYHSTGRVGPTDCAYNSPYNAKDKVEYYYYSQLHDYFFFDIIPSFKHKTVTKFVENYFADLYKDFLDQLKQRTGSLDAIKTNTALSPDSYDLKKDVVGWLSSLAAADELVKYLLVVSVDSLLKERKDLERKHKRGLSESKRRRDGLPEIPKTLGGLQARLEYGRQVEALCRADKPMSMNEIYNHLAIETGRDGKSFQRGFKLLKYVIKHCPVNAKDNLPKMHEWLNSLFNSYLSQE